ncbi:MAG TPA: CrcB family protein [Segeticoccus sp.]|nr:CrcB family protein [Segeticoccus sp.]
MPSRAVRRTVAVVALGGAVGAVTRHLVEVAWPSAPGGFPAAVLAINVVGSALIGVLMVAVTDVFSPHPLVRPFLGTGVLGGFTTFSTYAVDVHTLTATGETGLAAGLGYLVATPVVALLAVWLAASATRRLVDRRTR